MAAGLGLEPSHPVLETSALANILTRSIVFVFVCPKRQASFRFVNENMWYRGIPGTHNGIRTHTERILSPLPLPVGPCGRIAYWGQGATPDCLA